VRFAYVFGSVAAGTARPDSGIDLAVSVAPRGILFDDARLNDAPAARLGRDDVDLVVLEDAPLWLAYRVVRGHGESPSSRRRRSRLPKPARPSWVPATSNSFRRLG